MHFVPVAKCTWLCYSAYALEMYMCEMHQASACGSMLWLASIQPTEGFHKKNKQFNRNRINENVRFETHMLTQFETLGPFSTAARQERRQLEKSTHHGNNEQPLCSNENLREATHSSLTEAACGDRRFTAAWGGAWVAVRWPAKKHW